MNAEFDVTGVTIETERLVLRPFCQSDLSDLFDYAQVDGVGQKAGWAPHKNKTESQRILDMFIAEKKTFAIVYKQNGKVIGSLGIERLGKSARESNYKGREIGYVLSRDYWGNGLMPEAVKAVICYCFEKLGYDFVTCAHFDWNSQSKRVIEKCGFTPFGVETITTPINTTENCITYVKWNGDERVF